MTTTAKIIADSISESGIRITTLELEYPRFIHSQIMTHRMFSRSAQSSRAVPVERLIENVRNSKPPVFMKNKAGMQSTEFFNYGELIEINEKWAIATHNAIIASHDLLELGVHKQFVNRLLEPFTTIKVVITATEWDNFFALRLDHAAQPEMQELAQAMKQAIDDSIPEMLVGSWHLPYVDYDTIDLKGLTDCGDEALELCKLISAARCARVSYLNHDNTNPDIEKDLELANRLLKDKHLSPFEHQAVPIKNLKGFISGDLENKGVTHFDKGGFNWSGNFRGWIQHRQVIS